jgi:hypothetical protein
VNLSRSNIITIELAIVDQEIINIVKPIRRPIRDTLVEFLGVYESSIRDMMTIVNNNNTPIVTRSTQFGGRMNMLIVIIKMNMHGQINKLT